MHDPATTDPASPVPPVPAAAVTVRRVRSDEAELVREVRLAALADAPHAFASSYDRESRLTDDEWRSRSERGSSSDEIALFVALTSDARPVGTVGGLRRPETPSVVELVSMWVAPEVRGSGVGSSLIGAVVDWSRSVGADRVELWVIRGNDVAQRRYEAEGFTITTATQTVPDDPCREEIRMVRTV